MDTIRAKGVNIAEVTLHVGLGTFRPVQEDEITDHMSLEDLVITAGGLKESASLVRVDVTRRIRDPRGTTEPGCCGK